MYQLIIITLLIASSVSLSPTSFDNQAAIGSIKHSKKNVDQLDRSFEPEFLADTSGTVPSRRSNDETISNDITTIVSHNVLLPCAVRNIGSYKILWLRVKDGDVLAYDNLLITQDPRFSLIQNSVSESNLFIKNVRESDAGEYACQLNTETLKAKFVNLVVLTAPDFYETDVKQQNNNYHNALATVISSNDYTSYNKQKGYEINAHTKNNQLQSSPKSINIVEGNQITLECYANGVPKPVIKWFVKRYGSDSLIEFRSNTSRITIANVTRNQYDYFECEANNNVPPSISKLFKINVMYAPEVDVSPSKVYITTPPTQVKINCSVNSYPPSDIIWIYKNRQNSHKYRQHRRHGLSNEEEENEGFILENNLILNSELKYNIYLQTVNDTFKQSSILIDIENEKDYGVYACYANNSAGSKLQKFYIYGDHGRRKHGEKLKLDLNTQKQQVVHDTKNFMSVMPFKERIFPPEVTTTVATTTDEVLYKGVVATVPYDKNRNEMNKKLTSSIFNAVTHSMARRNTSLLSSHKILAVFFAGLFYLKLL